MLTKLEVLDNKDLEGKSVYSEAEDEEEGDGDDDGNFIDGQDLTPA